MKVVLCCPGHTFSHRFLYSLNELISFFLQHKILYTLSLAADNNIYYTRNRCLGGSVTRGKDQLPFNGEIDYTHILWIDSDILFMPNDFNKLLIRDKKIIAGYYCLENLVHSSVIQKIDFDVLKTKKHQNFMEMKDLIGLVDPFTVELSGMGFMLIQKGVFEKLSYPWFKPIIDDNDFQGDDASFCTRIRELGETIWVDPTVRVGHEKRIAL